MSIRQWRAAAAIIASLVGSSFLFVAAAQDKAKPAAAAQDPPEQEPTEPSPPFGIIGTNGCSARACHGSLEAAKPKRGAAADPQAISRTEYMTWVTKDKHAKAYLVLLNNQSKTIARNLAKIDGLGEPKQPAHQDARCLACHSVPSVSADGYAELAKDSRLRDGVSCESCHGPASKWLAEHTSKSWRDRSATEKHEKYDMNDTESLAGRAKVCAGCHVGAPADPDRGFAARDAFHDIMAAGHPRLNFEFSNFLASMPPHWTEHWSEKNQEKGFDARVWAIGQVAAAQQALRLLEGRAKAALADKAPWPEFAEYDCLACHHDLREPSWIQTERRYGKRTPGALPWGTWYLTMLKSLPAASEGKGKALVEQLESLEKLMSQPYPDPKTAADSARQAAFALDDWAANGGIADFSSQSLERLIKDWVKASQQPERLDWDAATQLYLALVAINQTVGNAQVRTSLDVLFEQLRKPLRDYEPEKFRNELEKLQKQLGQ